MGGCHVVVNEWTIKFDMKSYPLHVAPGLVVTFGLWLMRMIPFLSLVAKNSHEDLNTEFFVFTRATSAIVELIVIEFVCMQVMNNAC